MIQRDKPTSQRFNYTPSVAKLGGTFQNPGGSLWGFLDSDLAANQLGALQKEGILRVDKENTVQTFAIGDTVIYDVSAGRAVPPNLTVDADADYEIGVAVLAAAATDLYVFVLPERQVRSRYAALEPFVYEFDSEELIDVTAHTLIPAWMNRHGLLFMGAYGLITEVYAGAGEDQGIVTIEDSDGNDLSTLTATNAGADAVNDVIIGTNDIYTATSGDAAKIVPAGKGIRGITTQFTAGAGKAGKMKVYLRVIPLL